MILADTALIFFAIVSYFLAEEVGLRFPIVISFIIWSSICAIFVYSSEKFKTNDILMSIGLHGILYAFCVYLVTKYTGNRFVDVSGMEVGIVQFQYSLIVSSIVAIVCFTYILDFSYFRVPLGFSLKGNNLNSLYPGGGFRLRFLVALFGGLCFGLSGVLYAVTGAVSVDQWKSGLGFLLFGVAHAFQGRALFTVISGLLISFSIVIVPRLTVELPYPELSQFLNIVYVIVALVCIIVGYSIMGKQRNFSVK
jgi:hypothetical protein